MLSLTACGDFQDSASNVAYYTVDREGRVQAVLTNPGPTPTSSSSMSNVEQTLPTIPVTESNSNQPPGQASGADSSGDLPGSAPAGSIGIPPPASQSTQPEGEDESSTLPWLSPENLTVRTVTLAWDPPVTPNVTGYRISIRSLSSGEEYAFEMGLRYEMTVTLPTGDRYVAMVAAYNEAGHSIPAVIGFDLF